MFSENDYGPAPERETPGEEQDAPERGEASKQDGTKKHGGKKVKIPESEYEQLKEKCLKCDEYLDGYLRIRADFDNYRKRVNKEKESLSLYAIEEFASDFLGVLDNLERALEASEKTENFDSLHRGVEITLKDALKVLEKWGLNEVDALGEAFDPSKHEAFMTVEDSPEEEGRIVEVLRKGYYLKDKLIRPSLVKVAGRG